MRYLTLLIKSNLVETPMVLKTTFCVLLMFVSGAAGLCAEAEVAELAAPDHECFCGRGGRFSLRLKCRKRGASFPRCCFSRRAGTRRIFLPRCLQPWSETMSIRTLILE